MLNVKRSILTRNTQYIYHFISEIDTTNKVIVKLPEERKIAFVTRRKLIRNMATVEISLFPNKIPMEEYQRLQSHYVYDIIIQVILDTSDSSYDCNKMYSVKVTSLLRNEEKQERSNEKCRILQKIKHGRNNIRFSYKTGYDCEVRKLTKQGLGIEFEVTVMPEN